MHVKVWSNYIMPASASSAGQRIESATLFLTPVPSAIRDEPSQLM